MPSLMEKSISLSEIATFQQGKQVPIELQYDEPAEGLARFVRIIDYTNPAEPPRYIKDIDSKYHVGKDDLVMIRYGSQTAGSVVRGIEGIIANNLFQIKLTRNDFNKSFVYYFLSSPEVKQQLMGGQSSSTMPAITFGMMKNIHIPIFDYKKQIAVASIFDTISEKIRNNNKINQNLLHQVTAFFHDYFDEYEFSTEDTMLLGDVARFKYGTMPKKDKLGSGGYVAFSGYQVVGSYPERMFSDPQLIVVARGVGGCGDIKYTPADCYLTNLSIAILTSSIAMEDYLFNYLRLHDTKVMNTGSAQPQITVSTLEKYQLPIPPMDRLQSFSALVQPYKSMYRKNKDENERLQMLRDTLLPRLMSGELDVSEIEV